MCNFTRTLKDKTGNAIVYILNRTGGVVKTKILKLLYLMEYTMAKNYCSPFLGLPFEVWRLGPVQKDIYVDLSSGLSIFGDYITSECVNGNVIFLPVKEFDDSEFSDIEINVMDSVICKYGKIKTSDLIEMLHQKGFLWYESAVKNHLLELFIDNTATTSGVSIDFRDAITRESDKEEYTDCLAIRHTAESMSIGAYV